MVQRELNRVRQLQESVSVHGKNCPGPGKLGPKNSARHREYNKVNAKRR